MSGGLGVIVQLGKDRSSSHRRSLGLGYLVSLERWYEAGAGILVKAGRRSFVRGRDGRCRWRMNWLQVLDELHLLLDSSGDLGGCLLGLSCRSLALGKDRDARPVRSLDLDELIPSEDRSSVAIEGVHLSWKAANNRLECHSYWKMFLFL